jgi:hypothetical protein
VNETCASTGTYANDTNKNAPKLLFFNARSLKNAKTGADITAFMQTHSAYIMGINETWLKEGMRDHEFVSNSYRVFRKDRHEVKGGGNSTRHLTAPATKASAEPGGLKNA